MTAYLFCNLKCWHLWQQEVSFDKATLVFLPCYASDGKAADVEAFRRLSGEQMGYSSCNGITGKFPFPRH